VRGRDDDQETAIGEGDLLEARLWEDSDPRVFVTSSDDQENGRIFVWARTQWFERLSGDSGAVEFSPLSMDVPDLREWLREQDLEMTETDDELTALVREEFLNQNPLYPEAPELSNQEFEARP
jgi:hypothetical protein